MFSVTKLLTKLMIHNFALAGSVLSKNHGLATFVHERLEWSLVDQTPEKSGTEWSCVDVVWYIRSLTSTNLHRRDSHQRPSRHSQSVCWRLQPPACQLGLQHSISWPWEPGLLGDSQQPCVAARPKGSSPFLLSSMERGHQPGPGLRECRPGQPTAWQTCARKVHAVTQHRPSLVMPPKLKVPAYSDPVKRWNFRKDDWKRFWFLTRKSVEWLPPPDTTNVGKAYQELPHILAY